MNFERSDIHDINEFYKLNEGDLVRCGIASPLHQRQILQALAIGRNGGNSGSIKSIPLGKSVTRSSFSSNANALAAIQAAPFLQSNSLALLGRESFVKRQDSTIETISTLSDVSTNYMLKNESLTNFEKFQRIAEAKKKRNSLNATNPMYK